MMTGGEWLVVLAGVISIGVLAWYFFGPKQAGQAQLHGGVQEVTVTVKGGYAPDAVRVRQGVPVRLTFDRQEAGECTSRVVFPDFQVSADLPAFGSATVEVTPTEVGEHEFACGMNMIHGRLIVEPAGDAANDDVGVDNGDTTDAVGSVPSSGIGRRVDHVEFAVSHTSTCASCVSTIEGAVSTLPGIEAVDVSPTADLVAVTFDPSRVDRARIAEAVEAVGHRVHERAQPSDTSPEDPEATARQAEIRDLSRRVLLGAVLSTPVVVAVMATDLFGATWCPTSCSTGGCSWR